MFGPKNGWFAGFVGILLATNCLFAAPAVDPAEAPVLRHILPASALALVLARGEVEMVQWSDLKQLLKQGAAARAKKTLPQPEDRSPAFHYSSLEIEAIQGEAEGDAQIDLAATLVVAKPGYLLVPLMGPGPTPADFKASKKGSPRARAHLVGGPQGYSVLVGEPGTWTFRLRGWSQIKKEGHLSSLAIRVPPVPGGIGRAKLLGENLEVFMDPAPETRVLTVAAGVTRTEALLPPGSPFQVQWFPRDAGLVPEADQGDQPEVPSAGLRPLGTRSFATWTQALVLGHGSLEARVRLVADIHRAPISMLSVRLDGPYENLEVKRDPRLIEAVTKVPGGLDIHLTGERQGRVQLDLSYRYRDPEGHPSFEVEVPRPRLEGAWSERTFLWIGRSTNVAITPKLTGQVEAVSAGVGEQLPQPIHLTEALLRYRIEDPRARLNLTVQRYPDAPGIATRVIDTATASTRLSSRGRSRTSLELVIRDRTGAPLKVKLPAGATPVLFQRDGVRVHPKLEDDGTVNIPLRAEGGGVLQEEVRLQMAWAAPTGTGPFGNLAATELELAQLGVQVMELVWDITPPDGYRLVAPQGGPDQTRIRVTRRLIQPDGNPMARKTTVSLRSWQAQELLRFGKLLLGVAAGWLLCAVLVGGLPLGAAGGLLCLLLATGYSVSMRGTDPIRDGLLAALALGLLVGLRRSWSAYRSRRAKHAADIQSRQERLIELRQKLSEKVGLWLPEPPAQAPAPDEPEPPPPDPVPQEKQSAPPADKDTGDEPDPNPRKPKKAPKKSKKGDS